jgi:hypothetical protein
MSTLKQLIDQYCPNGVDYVRLEQVVDYEQPTKYLVKSTDYDDSFETPVLTAGKTFLLGYTNETDGIYKATPANPVVIFDDFTTASKWVNFPFKAKSSAMKFLTPKDDTASLRFVFLALHDVEVDTTDHKRQWIRTFSRELIPLPPREIQDKIVEFLDTFAALRKNLDMEIAQREKQFAEYRELLCNSVLNNVDVPTKRLGELGIFYGGLRGKTKKDFGHGTGRFVPYTSVFNNREVNFDALEAVELKADERQQEIQNGDVLFTGSSETLDEVGLTSVVTRDPDGPVHLNSFCFGFRFNTDVPLNSQFVKHLMMSSKIRKQIKMSANGVTRINISKKSLAKNVLLPFPSLNSQRAIAEKLDAMQELIDNLRLEREQRQQQFDYYREKLLSFSKKETTEV